MNGESGPLTERERERDVLVVDRSAGTGWRPETPEQRGAPGAAGPPRKYSL